MTVHGGNIFAVCRARGWDWREVLDFSASINPLGPSPRVNEAIQRALGGIVHYPDPYAARLSEALAREWDVSPGEILLGNGATDLIHFLARTWRQERVTLIVPTFSEFHRAWPEAGCAPLEDASRWPDEGLLVLTRPNNPTGWTAPLDWLRRRDQPMLIDESFIDFCGEPAAIGLSRGTVVLRSLTKFHGIPGLRVGALVGDLWLMEQLRAWREPWQVNVLAEEAALAALADGQHAARTRRLISGERERLWEELRSLPGVRPEPAGANFYFVRLDYPAEALCDHLMNYKILMRNCSGWPGVSGEAARLAIRLPEENDRLLAAWRAFHA